MHTQWEDCTLRCRTLNKYTYFQETKGNLFRTTQSWNFILQRARPFSFWKRALPLENLYVNGKLWRGTKAKTRGNGGNVLCGLRVIPGLTTTNFRASWLVNPSTNPLDRKLNIFTKAHLQTKRNYSVFEHKRFGQLHSDVVWQAWNRCSLLP